MHISFLGAISGSSIYAALRLSHTVEAPNWKTLNLEEIAFGHALGFPKSSLISQPDVIVTSSYAIVPVMTIIKAQKPSIVLWDLGPKAPTKSQINRVSAPLQIAGYEVTLIKGLSSHELGYNYQEDRAIIVARRGATPVVFPPKLRMRRPFTPLSSIVATQKDVAIIPFINGNMLFHVEPRPWSYVSKPSGDSYIKAHPLSIKVGAVWYAFSGKLHRLTFAESAAIVGLPIECQRKLGKIIDDDGFAVYTILRDISYPLWLDIMERCLHADNK